MEEYLKQRPHKKIYPNELVDQLRQNAIDKLKSKLLPDKGIFKIILIGSSIKGSFGEYDLPGFRDSLFSDFDFIVFVDDEYQIPKWLNREPNGRPVSDNDLNLAYRNKNFFEDKYDLEVFFIRHRNFENIMIQEEGELAGIPMTHATRNFYLEVYKK